MVGPFFLLPQALVGKSVHGKTDGFETSVHGKRGKMVSIKHEVTSSILVGGYDLTLSTTNRLKNKKERGARYFTAFIPL